MDIEQRFFTLEAVVVVTVTSKYIWEYLRKHALPSFIYPSVSFLTMLIYAPFLYEAYFTNEYT